VSTAPAGAAPRDGDLKRAAVFLLPCLLPFEVALLGRLFLPECLLLLALPLLLARREAAVLEPLPRAFLALALVWLLAQVLTDMARGIPFTDYARGWAKIVFFLLDFVALYLLLSPQPDRLTLFAWGLAAGGLLQFIISPNEFAATAPWKFGAGASVTLASLLLVMKFWARRPLAQAAALSGLSLLNLYLNFRSMGGICFLTALFLFLRWRLGPRPRLLPAVPRMVTVAGWLALSLAVFWGAYGYATQLAGREAQLKEKAQSGKLGVLVGGRMEAYGALRAIADSPLVGYGSWAKDRRYALAMIDLAQYGYEIDPLRVTKNETIPSHSHLLGAWVEAGVAGTLFWLLSLAVIVRVLWRLLRVAEPLAPLVVFVGATTLWNILFSPFGAEMRLWDAYALAMFTAVDRGTAASLPGTGQP
jgi:O-antigen ligase